MTDSPLHYVDKFADSLGITLQVKRDDLLPFTGGGNKVRKVAYILGGAATSNANAVITNGGVQSNHARVVALEAARRGWPCSLVLHGDKRTLEGPTGNLLLMVLSGAHIQIVAPDEIGGIIQKETERFQEAGFRPFVVPGGGHSLEGALAYVDAVKELAAQMPDTAPDIIVHASGTGATQAGLIAGCVQQGWPTKVIGVSVARRNPRGEDAVREVCDMLHDHLGCPELSGRIDFRDDWVGGGYDHADDRVFATIARVARETGILLDPTYTGKAFQGLLDLVDEGDIPAESRVVFWHTGGLLNLLADPHIRLNRSIVNS